MNNELDPYSRAAHEFINLLETATDDYYLAAVARTLLRRTLVTAEAMAVLDGCPARRAHVAALRTAAAPWVAASTPNPPTVPADGAGILAEIQRSLERAKPIIVQALTAFPFLAETPMQHAHFADGVSSGLASPVAQPAARPNDGACLRVRVSETCEALDE